MKNYLKNKNFIPRNYINGIKNSRSKGDKRGLIYLIIINFIILPININGLFKKEKEVEVKNTVPIEEVNKEVIINWISEIDKDVVNIKVENNSAVMSVKSQEKIYFIEERGNMTINNISENEKGYYILEVTRNNK